MGQLEIDEYHVRTIWNMLLPRGGFVVIYQSYSDASVTQSPGVHTEDRILSVATFMFDKDKIEEFNGEWVKILEPFLRNEPLRKRYFHMHDFYTRKPPYHFMSEGQRASLQRDLIDSAHKHMEFGVVASVRLCEYDKAVSDPELRKVMGGPFTMCNLWCAEMLCAYLDDKHLDGDIAYAFEDGDTDKLELDGFLTKIASSEYLSKKYRYGGRSFMLKHQNHALGAADMLAWEYRNGIEQHFKDPDADKRVFVRVLFEKLLGRRHFSQTAIAVRTMGQMIERANRWAAEQSEPENMGS